MAKAQQAAAHLHEVMGAMQRNQPEAAEGSDAQGAVQVRIGQDGLPQYISVATDWHRRSRPEALGSAVAEACQAAASELMAAWAQGLQRTDLDRKLDDLERGEPSHSPGAATPAAPTSTTQQDWQHVNPRSMGQLSEDVISALSDLSNLDAQPTDVHTATGRDSARNVTITLTSSSLASCDVDAQWASNQTAVRLNRAFDEALADALAGLRESARSGNEANTSQTVDTLLAEAMALLTDPRRIAGY
ncbi:hypothetical protein ACFQVC_32920 [Streptomyces monticola]|uniref:YbaB/EbfC family nucleoid-associated protein n=1 Tax=Streptomyces monticola TaxID=2666263 RepID=A0ABW2JUH0_9ACTN